MPLNFVGAHINITFIKNINKMGPELRYDVVQMSQVITINRYTSTDLW